LSDAALEEKFFSLAGRVMAQEQAEELLEQLWRLDTLESVFCLCGSLRGQASLLQVLR
jgi:hypothetical protein